MKAWDDNIKIYHKEVMWDVYSFGLVAGTCANVSFSRRVVLRGISCVTYTAVGPHYHDMSMSHYRIMPLVQADINYNFAVNI
jgi:hypothetical protein